MEAVIMIFDEDLLRKIVVQICGKNSKGSGLIVPSTEPGRFYCLTAKHCLDEDEISLTQLTSSSVEITLEYADILIDPDEKHDLAIILLKNYSAQLYPQKSVFVGYVNKAYTKGKLVGFPQSRNGLAIYNASFVSMDKSNNTLKMQLTDTNTSQEDLKNQINGISGGGIFVVEDKGEYKILAIETELADKNAGFNEIIGITLAMANNLLKNKGWSLLASPKYRYTSMTWGEGRNVLIKEKECHSNSVWVNTKGSDILIKMLQDHLFEEGAQPLLLCGFSGIGKTRTVLQACIQNPELSNALFFDCYDQFNNVFNTKLRDYCNNSAEEPIYLIVDDVSFDEWDKLTGKLKNYKNVRTISIAEMGQKDSSHLTRNRIISMIPCDIDDVVMIVHNHCPVLSDEELRSIFRLSDNDLRFALLIADAYSQSYEKELWSLTARHSGRQILDRIMTQVVDKRYIEIIKIFSLFVDFEYNGNSKQEIDFIKDYFKLNEIILNKAIDFCADHRLGIKRGNYFELSPRVLARLLFSEYHMCIVEDYSDFMDRLPTDELRRRFIMRAYECGSETWKEVRGILVSWFQNKYGQATLVVSSGIFGNKRVELSAGNITEAMTYVEFIPDDGLRWLQFLIENTDGYVLDNFLGYSGRRKFVWTCEHLSCFEEYFEICENILFKLSNHETEGGLSNNSSGVWSELYGIVVSNTEYSFINRLNRLINRMCNCENEQNHDLFKSALSYALSMSGTRLLPPKMVGGRLTPANWTEQHIHTMYEMIGTYMQIITILNKNAEILPTSMQHVVFQALKDHIAEYTSDGIIMFSFELYKRYRKTLERFAVTEEQRLEIVIAINIQLEYEKYSREDDSDSSVSNQRVDELIQWRDSIAENDLVSRIKILLAKNPFPNIEDYTENIRELVVELLENSDASNMLMEMLSLNDICDYSFSLFAHALGELDTSYKLKEVIGVNFVSGSNSFSDDYYIGIYNQNKTIPDFVKQILDQAITQNPNGVLKIRIVCDFSNEGTERIIGLLEEGIINNYIFALGEQWQIRQFSLVQMERIICALVKNCTYDSIFYFFKIGEMWLDAFPHDELENILYQYIIKIPLNERQRNSTGFVEMLEHMHHHLLECLNLVIQSIDYSSFLDTQTAQILFIKKHSHGQYAKEIAFGVCDCLEAQFNQVPCTLSFSLLINLLVPDMVLKWIKYDPNERAKIIAYHLPAPSLEEINVPEITLKVLEQYENNEKVFCQFIIGIHAFETYTLESVEKNSVKTFAMLEKYKNHKLALIRKWAEYEINQLKSLIKEKEQLDSMYNRFSED